MLAKRLIKSNDAGGGGACTNTVDLYNPFPDGGGIALYQLNGDATDVSGNYDGTATNVTYGTGQFGQAGVFNGSSSYIGTSLNFATTAKTVSLWFKIPNTGVYGTVVSSNNNGTGDPLLAAANWHNLQFNSSGNVLTFSVLTSIGGWERVSTTTSNFSINTWYNVTVTNDATILKIYLNGVLENTTALVGTILTGLPYIEIGGNTNTGGTTPVYYNGSIDQVRMFNIALRPYEIEALYTEEYCTPTIVPSEHFNTVTYTGNGGVKSITGLGFEPNFVWIKNRVEANNHVIFDSVRGDSNGNGYYDRISPNLTTAEQGDITDAVQTLDADGFTVHSAGDGSQVNDINDDYVAWNFKAGGSAVTNTDGTITSQVSANTEAGFSVVTFTSPNGASDTSYTVGHGLGITPNVVICKSRNATDAWYTYHSGATNNNQFIVLNTTGAVATAGSAVWGAGMTNNVIGVTLDQSIDQNDTNVAYCFAEVEGFSNFGSYAGTGASGNTIVTGFEPAMVIAKMTSAADSWRMYDNKRIGSEGNGVLYPNSSTSEGNVNHITFLENGFVWNSDNCNSINQKFIYMAFAADPTTIEPSLEDSFNTVTYTGNGGTQTIGGVGFQPDLVWTKGRTVAFDHGIQDSVRGVNSLLYPSVNEQETITTTATQSFDSNGFTYGSNNKGNASGTNYVAWCWKAAEIPAINSNGSIKSVVSANPAAGFSIVSYTGNSIVGSTVGHGLGQAPDVVIMKGRQQGLPQYYANWGVYHSALGVNKRLWMNTSDAVVTTGNGDWINNTAPTEDVFTVSEYYINWTGRDFIAYCFAEVAGFSKFGSYTGTGAAGNFQDCGFEPAFVMVKSSSNIGNWGIWDNKRSPSNPRDRVLIADGSNSEFYPDVPIDFTLTGFSFNTSGYNNSGQTFIYMAFANQF